jgi:hypothetical protein
MGLNKNTKRTRIKTTPKKVLLPIFSKLILESSSISPLKKDRSNLGLKNAK